MASNCIELKCTVFGASKWCIKHRFSTFKLAQKLKTFILIVFFLNIKHVCLIQIKCVDFNSTQFNAFSVEFKAIQHNSMYFRIVLNSTIQHLFEMRQINIKKHWIALNLMLKALNCIELKSTQFICIKHMCLILKKKKETLSTKVFNFRTNWKKI